MTDNMKLVIDQVNAGLDAQKNEEKLDRLMTFLDDDFVQLSDLIDRIQAFAIDHEGVDFTDEIDIFIKDMI